MDKTIQLFINDLKAEHPDLIIFTDKFKLLAKGVDASFYKLLPKIIIQVNNENEVISVLKLANKYKLPLTFRAAGTSLSGQAITNSILVETGNGFNYQSIIDNGTNATFGSAVVGGYANKKLSKYKRKLGPSPASISSAKIGGIVANNASGSSYGIAYNSYNTIKDMRIILADGTLLDTSDKNNCEKFKFSHAYMCNNILNISKQAKSNPDIYDKIKSKYELKNTCGYGVNSLIDFEDPIDILKHLMIGSEGTLGFISNVTFETVPDYKLKATSLIFFPHIHNACESIIPLRKCKVSAAELMDRNALRSVENNKSMPNILKKLGNDAVALLIDTSADDEETLSFQINEIIDNLKHIETLLPIEFTTDIHIYNTYWNVRKGLFTSAAATRPEGTACIIEDIAFHANVLSDALVDLQKLLVKYNYPDAVIWGHLLDGNIHFVIMPDFKSVDSIENYKKFMFDLVELTIDCYNGSLKAEHGTGLNMAPFVEYEWGKEIYHLMKQIKSTIDPANILNPGVLINNDPDIFIKNLKPLPLADDLIDKCIECGFCEVQCPSRNLTLTPRQRIVVFRELQDLANNKNQSNYYKQLLKEFNYEGNATCATDGLCELSCPVGINTGRLIKTLRWKHNSKLSLKIATIVTNKMGIITLLLTLMLRVPHFMSKIIGYKTMERFTYSLYKISKHKFPLWTRYTPSGNTLKKYNNIKSSSFNSLDVVYFPSCINRSMGISSDYDEKIALTKKTEQLLLKANCNVIYPCNLNKLCCGMAFDSKGFKEQGMKKTKELEIELLRITDNGRIPILCDMSPCLFHMKTNMDKRLQLYEPIEFILKYLKNRLQFKKLPEEIAIHSTCSNTKMGLENKIVELATMCAEDVLLPDNIGCCAWAGDRGFFYPELNKSALENLKNNINPDIKYGYSTSRTCEIGLTMNSGISYKSIIYLVDKATTKINV